MKARYNAEEKSAVLAIVPQTVIRTGWSVRRILKRLGIARAVLRMVRPSRSLSVG